MVNNKYIYIYIWFSRWTLWFWAPEATKKRAATRPIVPLSKISASSAAFKSCAGWAMGMHYPIWTGDYFSKSWDKHHISMISMAMIIFHEQNEISERKSWDWWFQCPWRIGTSMRNLIRRWKFKMPRHTPGITIKLVDVHPSWKAAIIAASRYFLVETSSEKIMETLKIYNHT